MTTNLQSRPSRTRRRLLQSAAAVALVPWLPANAAADELPEIPALTAFLGGRKPRLARVHLTLPQLADNGQTVPMKVSVDGPFAPGPRVTAINLFSEANPVPEMAVFEFPAPVERVEVESRVRLAASQRVVAVALMSDNVLYAAAAEVIVTIAGCMDGT
jgi:sulfur-oxidizing protein SoxY